MNGCDPSFPRNVNEQMAVYGSTVINAGWQADQRLPNVDNNTFSYLYNSTRIPGVPADRRRRREVRAAGSVQDTGHRQQLRPAAWAVFTGRLFNVS
jgi:hypothetical protein